MGEIEGKLGDNTALLKLESQMRAKEADMLQQIERVREEKALSEQHLETAKATLEKAEQDKQALMIDLEAKTIDMEAMALEMELLKDEKEELLSQIKAGAEVNENDVIHAMGEDELRTQN